MKLYGVLLAFLFLSCSTERSTLSTMDNVPVIIAHRGASGHAPENTLPAIMKAIDVGADYVEIDVHLSKDGKVVVIHDHTLERTTSGTGDVLDYDWNDLKELDAGSWGKWAGGEFEGTKLMILEEVIEAIKGRAKLLIEVKKGEDYYDGIEAAIIKVIKENNAEEWCEIQTFYDPVLENFVALDDKLVLHKLIYGKLPAVPVYGDHKLQVGKINPWGERITGINPNQGFARNGFVKKAHTNGHKVFVWTVNEEAKMRKLINVGVDGIITNYPEKVKKVLRQMGENSGH